MESSAAWPPTCMTPARDTNGSRHRRTGAARRDREDQGILDNALVVGFEDPTGGDERKLRSVYAQCFHLP